VHTPEEDLVRLYLSDIGRHPLLTKDEEVRLAQVVEAGREAHTELALVGISPTRVRELRRVVRAGEVAVETFTNGNLRLVVSIAKRYQVADLPLLDLVQEGNLGLMHAVEKFDWRKGFKFSTYATWWIRQAIARGITNGGRTIRLPVHAGDLLNRVVKARARLEAQHGRRASVAELAADLEVSADKVAEILRHVVGPVSLSEPLRHDSDAELGDVVEDYGAVSPFEAAATALLSGEVAKMLAGLEDREREVIQLRFGLGCGRQRTLEEVGARFGLTRERIRQIEARAMEKLRHPSVARNNPNWS
jgi:RNA polymerase sigma factor (sigma-70 family)